MYAIDPKSSIWTVVESDFSFSIQPAAIPNRGSLILLSGSYFIFCRMLPSKVTDLPLGHSFKILT